MDGLLRFSGASRRHPDVAAWFAETPEPLRQIARGWFLRVRACGPDVLELVHDGCPVACVADAPFAYVDAFTAHVNVGFFRGSALPDPARLLIGTGRRMRHVKLRPGQPTDVDALAALVAAAYDDIRRQLG